RNGRHVHRFAVVRQQYLAGRRLDGSQDATGCRRLATSALADQRQRLPAIDEEAHVIDRFHLSDRLAQESASNREILLEPPDLEERGRLGVSGGVAHSYRKQLVFLPSPTATSRGSCASQRPDIADAQRGWNGQPLGRLNG